VLGTPGSSSTVEGDKIYFKMIIIIMEE